MMTCPVEAGGGSAGRTVVVGVKLDSPSKELLTWALVKVSQSGDTVVALHVLDQNEIVNRDGKSSLLSLVKAFDPVLAVYEGFCNLKQVDLKLKICRGSSVKKILVREAIAYSATHVVLGTCHGHHKIRSSTSVAKYCAKKLSKDCCVLAINNGKVVFKRDGLPPTATTDSQGHRNGLLGSIHWKISKSTKVLSDESAGSDAGKSAGEFSDHSLAKILMDTTEFDRKDSCSVCDTTPALPPLPDSSCHQSSEEESCSDGVCDNSLAIVPVPAVDTAPPELKPGWPLLHQRILSETQFPERLSARQISVVQWAMRLPSRNLSYSSDQDHKPQDESVPLYSETGAIVPVDYGINTVSSPEPNSESIPLELASLHGKYSSICRLFEYQELVSATSNFLPENLIGKGGSSEVYRGCLPDGQELAVKILKPSDDVLKEFLLEIEIITTLNHKNIISLLGFCFENGNLLLVYDLLSRGSLEENLHGSKKNSLVFGWSERYKVAMGVAEALDYLHCKDDQPVIHRDVKSSNVLLSEDFEPKLSDFGLAKWASTSSSQITCTDVAGTFGYLAPEYFMYGKVHDKIDVYAFGVVLLELLSGRKPISGDLPKGQESLIMWISKLLHGDADVIKWARSEVNAREAPEMLEDEACPPSNLQSHLNLALLDVEDDLLSMCSVEQHVSLEDYLRGRWSRSSSFD
ncbi:hypothetical protein PIB30_049491 [Stylosanthes scabra]|uniref:Protein kinase domain-containing protein n=1 Tax=Stylosanthes scabra TaxID=79078 RepID=A0ABU6RHQ2_9FABA|nr:hypothetical protein [Stylosanthes scabra]